MKCLSIGLLVVMVFTGCRTKKVAESSINKYEQSSITEVTVSENKAIESDRSNEVLQEVKDISNVKSEETIIEIIKPDGTIERIINRQTEIVTDRSETNKSIEQERVKADSVSTLYRKDIDSLSNALNSTKQTIDKPLTTPFETWKYIIIGVIAIFILVRVYYCVFK